MKCKQLLVAAVFSLLSLASHGAIIWHHVAFVTNATNPSVWESHSFDVTSHVSGAGSAVLSFDLRNDAPNPPFPPNPTTASVDFGVDDVTGDFFARFAYVSGGDTSHFRDFKLLVDDVLYRDQYGAFNNHLGDEFRGTAQQGNFRPSNILGERGPSAAIYSLRVPEPSTMILLSLGLLVLGFGSIRVSNRG